MKEPKRWPKESTQLHRLDLCDCYKQCELNTLSALIVGHRSKNRKAWANSKTGREYVSLLEHAMEVLKRECKELSCKP